MKLDGYPFDGWDWQELAQAWNLYMPDSYAGKDMYKYAEKKRLETWQERAEDAKRTYGVIEDNGTVTEYLWSGMFGVIDWSVNNYEDFNEYDPVVWYINSVMKGYQGDRPTRVMSKMANDIRAFARALSKSEISYYAPFWEGLSKIESDWTIIGLITMDYPLIAHMWD